MEVTNDMERMAGPLMWVALMMVAGAFTFALSGIGAIIYSAGNINHTYDRLIKAFVIGAVVGGIVTVIGATVLIIALR